MHNLSQFTCNLSLSILTGRSPWAGKPFDLPSNIWAAHTETHIPLWQRLPIVPWYSSSPSFFYYKVLIFSKAHVCPARSLLSYSLLLLGVARWPSYCQWNASTSGMCDFLKRNLFALFLPMGWSVGVMGSQLWPCRWGQAPRGRQNHRWKEHETLGDFVEYSLLFTLASLLFLDHHVREREAIWSVLLCLGVLSLRAA